jgi:hypothetical protein
VANITLWSVGIGGAVLVATAVAGSVALAIALTPPPREVDPTGSLGAIDRRSTP